MPEINLGIGRQRGIYEGWEREWLYWYDQDENRFPSPHEQLEQERQRAEQERRLREELVTRLRARGIDLDNL